MKSNAKGLASWVMNTANLRQPSLFQINFKGIPFKPSSRMYSREQMRALLSAHPFMWLGVCTEKAFVRKCR